MTPLERMFKIMELKNIKAVELAEHLNINKSVISGWKSRNINPPTDYLVSICSFLGTSLNYLLIGENDTQKISTIEQKFEKVNFDNLTQSIKKLSNNHIERVFERIETYLEEEKQDNIVECSKVKYIPKLGNTAAGSPIYLPEDYISSDLIPLPESNKADFALTVRGDSMEPDIPNGSTIYIRQTPSVEDGTVVIIAIDDTVTCKKFYKNKDNIELRSINPKYGPIIIGPNSHVKIRIIGEVVNV